MEEDRPKALRDRLQDPIGFMLREHGEEIAKYRDAGRIGRWFIRRTNPYAAECYDAIQAINSVQETRRAAAADPFNEVPLGAV